MELLLHDIYWLEDSPYGTYLQDDRVQIFWDDATEDIVVRKNGSIVTSGDDIPVTFTYFVFPDTYYKTETHYYTLICNLSSEKIDSYRTISAFPYVTVIAYPNHPSCGATTLVCDLVFDSIPEVTNSSTSTTAY